MQEARFDRIRLRHPRRGLLRIEVRRPPGLRRLAWGSITVLSLFGSYYYTHVFLLLPALCLLLEGNACIEISRSQIAYGTSFFGLFFLDESTPLRAVRDVRVEEQRYRQWGPYRGPEDDHNAEGQGRNCVAPYLVLDEGVVGVKLPLGLSAEEQEWLADYLQSLARGFRGTWHPAA